MPRWGRSHERRRDQNPSIDKLYQIIVFACESPADYGRPITHWTHRELAEEAIKQGIVDSISPHWFMLKQKPIVG